MEKCSLCSSLISMNTGETEAGTRTFTAEEKIQ